MKMNLQIKDVNNQDINLGDKVKVSWLASLEITELDCESVGTVQYMPDGITAAFFVELDKKYERYVCEDGTYEEERIMLIQPDEDMHIIFEKLN